MTTRNAQRADSQLLTIHQSKHIHTSGRLVPPSPCLGKAIFVATLSLFVAVDCKADLSFDWINRATSGFASAEEAVIDAAFSIWQDALPTPTTRNLEVEINTDLLTGALGMTTDFRYDALGNPVGASVIIDSQNALLR